MKLDQETLKNIKPGVAPGGNSVFNQLNQLVNNVRELLKLYQGLQGQSSTMAGYETARAMQKPGGGTMEIERPKALNPGKENPPPDPAIIAVSGIARLLDIAIQSGQGDKSVKEILELAGPMSIKQIRGLLK